MPTLMSDSTFQKLNDTRNKLVVSSLMSTRQPGTVAGLFVPWAGADLIREGGIYYVGICTKGDFCPKEQSLADRLQFTQCLIKNRNLSTSPFWQFLDGLTWSLLGLPYDEARDRLGWSNLFKIGWDQENWPAGLEDQQREVCANSIREEFGHLSDSLVVIVSYHRYGILDHPEVFRNLVSGWKDNHEENWCKNYDGQTGIWWFKDQKSGNLYVHGYHPRAALSSRRIFGSALGRTVQLARLHLSRFASLP